MLGGPCAPAVAALEVRQEMAVGHQDAGLERRVVVVTVERPAAIDDMHAVTARAPESEATAFDDAQNAAGAHVKQPFCMKH